MQSIYGDAITVLSILYLICLSQAYVQMNNYIRVNWNELSKITKSIIPQLSYDVHKGFMGRIAIIGGSPEYTGAPYYAGMSALKFGADLCYVFCAKQALLPIKSYSPELMVTGFYDADDIGRSDIDDVHANLSISVDLVTRYFSRLHVIVIGPGLGRNAYVMNIVSQIIREAVRQSKPMVIDADGLWLLSQNLSLLRGCKASSCILTPNKPEFDNLISAALAELAAGDVSDDVDIMHACMIADLKSTDEARKMRALSRHLGGGIAILKKGRDDVFYGGDEGDGSVYLIEALGSMRRCGGQGDILSGVLAVSLHWALMRGDDIGVQQHSTLLDASKGMITCPHPGETSCSNSHEPTPAPLFRAAALASVATKRASFLAFQSKTRSMTSPDVIERIGESLISLEEEAGDVHI